VTAPTPYWTDGQITLYCGDEKGYRRHLRLGERACEACRSGHAAYERTRTEAKRRARPPQAPRVIGGPCANCSAATKHLRRGWCFACYQRWLKAGRPESGPPPLRSEDLAKWREASVAADERPVSDLAAGTAAEHLVCADLILGGWRAFLSDQNCPYDIAVDIGSRLIRVQVKSTRAPKAVPQRTDYVPAYQFAVRRSGKGGQRRYTDDAFDLLALVALDVRRIAYMPLSLQRQTVHIRPPGAVGRTVGKQFDDFPFAKCVAELGVA
jgi:hypothetical protein